MRAECCNRMEASVSCRVQDTPASDDEHERRLRVLLRDEGSTATTGKAEGCRCGRSTYPARSTLDPLQGRRSSKVLVAKNRLLKSTFRPRPRIATDTIVQSLSGDAVALPGLA
jgi:hypothetical protein